MVYFPLGNVPYMVTAKNRGTNEMKLKEQVVLEDGSPGGHKTDAVPLWRYPDQVRGSPNEE
jgi:hypothetical protein